MANYKESVIETARGLYVVEGKTVQQVSELLKIPQHKFEWDKDIRSGGGFNLFLEMQKQFVAKIEQAVELEKLTDPAMVDSLWKLAKLMERMMPAKIRLSNIFMFLEDMVTYFVNCGESQEFMERLHKQVPLLADWLRKKYTNE
jgi:hypothetical protein